ncbi:MAG TPA: flagellar hook-basal body complex protein FliE [Bryobacteraceae bacterium]|nr:flagellar hook-basal body complex protein FliE [Bryobacteraceae bacterium]
MPAPILPVSATTIPDPGAIRPAGETPSGTGFQEVFTSAIRQVESMGQAATASVERFLSGEGEDLHTTVLATQRAELAFELFQQVRNKVVSAYQEIMRMQM